MDRNELASFLNRVNDNLDDAGILADWLEENGDDIRGKLLRLRWKRFRTEFERARSCDEQDERRLAEPWNKLAAGLAFAHATFSIATKVVWRRAEASERFRRYIRRVFEEMYR